MLHCIKRHKMSAFPICEAQRAHLLLPPYSLLRTSHFTPHVNAFSYLPQPSYWSPYYLASYSESPTNESNLLFQSHGALSWHMLYVIAKLNCLWLSTDLHTCVKKLSETLGKNQQNKYNNPLSLDTVSRKRRRRRGQKKLAEEINNGPKFPKQDENYKPTYLRSSMKHKQSKHEESYTKAYPNQITKTQW